MPPAADASGVSDESGGAGEMTGSAADRPVLVTGEAAMRELGAALAHSLPTRAVVTLSGELGVGKSVLARAMLHALGHVGHVPSPTYAIVESYALPGRHVAHLDLYRLADPGELHDIGFDDVVDAHDTLLVEWPERGGTLLPAADVEIVVEHAGEGARRVRVRRPADRLDDSPSSPML